MNTEYNIPIVVVAYNRPHSLSRILHSLNSATYPQAAELIISVDKSDVPEVLEVAQAFDWKHGKKQIIVHPKNLGLRNHVLACGNLSSNYDAIILLEDDLFVSPGFYSYTLHAVDFYLKDPKISGISLYAHSYNETAHKPFIPVSDNSDVFFMQLPSSWGQCWTKKQWGDFIKWYNIHEKFDVAIEKGIPTNVSSWPKTSWKKYFVWFLIDTERYFVYPRFSLTTNCGDAGTHFNKKLYFQQVPLLTTCRDFKFASLLESIAVYDASCEILPKKLNILVPSLRKYSYTVDLYGCKHDHQIMTKHILTTKKCTKFIKAFSREIKPHEANIISGIEGDEIFLAPASNYIRANNQAVLSEKELSYFFNVRGYQIPKIKTVYKKEDYSVSQLLSMFAEKVLNKFRTMFHKTKVN